MGGAGNHSADLFLSISLMDLSVHVRFLYLGLQNLKILEQIFPFLCASEYRTLSASDLSHYFDKLTYLS